MSLLRPRTGIQGAGMLSVAEAGVNPAALGGALTYSDRVIATGPIAYWIQGEAAGLVAIDQILSPLQDGTYAGVTLGQPGIGDGNTAPYFDGANDYNNVFTATFTGRFDGDEGTVFAWARVTNLAVWSDGAIRTIFNIRRDARNQMWVDKVANVGRLRYWYESANFIKTFNSDGHTETDWFTVAITWSDTADEARFYFDGVQVGLTQSGFGPWEGPITAAVIGAANTVPASVWDGWLAHIAVWDRPLTPAEVLDLSTL